MNIRLVSNVPSGKQSAWEREAHISIVNLREAFWKNSWSKEQVRDVLHNFGGCSPKEASSILRLESFQRNSDWLFLSFLYWSLKRSEFIESPATKHILAKAILPAPNLLATFQYLDQKQVPGTIKGKSRMMVLISEDYCFQEIQEDANRWATSSKAKAIDVISARLQNPKAFDFVQPNVFVNFMRVLLHHRSWGFDLDEIKQLLFQAPIIGQKIKKFRHRNPSDFCQNLISCRNTDERELMKMILPFLPKADLRKSSLIWSHDLLASFLRQSISDIPRKRILKMSRKFTKIEDPMKDICLYRKFPKLIALLVAVEDIEMIQCLSDHLKIPVGPCKWVSKDMSKKKVGHLGKSIVCYKSPIFTAIHYKNQQLAELLCKSCPLPEKKKSFLQRQIGKR